GRAVGGDTLPDLVVCRPGAEIIRGHGLTGCEVPGGRFGTLSVARVTLGFRTGLDDHAAVSPLYRARTCSVRALTRWVSCVSTASAGGGSCRRTSRRAALVRRASPPGTAPAPPPGCRPERRGDGHPDRPDGLFELVSDIGRAGEAVGGGCGCRRGGGRGSW